MMWQIDAFPFVWSHRTTPSNAPLPDTLPFMLGEDSRTGRLLQIPTDALSHALDLAYRTGSVITGAMAESGLGKRYADDFLQAVLNEVLKSGRRSLRILEIGCGNGYLSAELARLGHQVTGIDPGPQLEETESERLSLIRDFFPSARITAQYDLIIAYALLEHIADPETFLRNLHPYLTSTGTILIAVPDCEPPIELGDLSMLVHEHYSYFSPTTLKLTIEQSGFAACAVRRAGFGGMIYASAIAASGRKVSEPVLIISQLDRFRSRAESNLSHLGEFMQSASQLGQSVGFVVPGRVVNALTRLNLPLNGIRFFDDNSTLHGTYYPPISIPIEPTPALQARPTDWVCVMSQTFGEQIAGRLRAILPAESRIVEMSELYEVSRATAH